MAANELCFCYLYMVQNSRCVCLLTGTVVSVKRDELAYILEPCVCLLTGTVVSVKRDELAYILEPCVCLLTGTVVSVKRDELAYILEHFNIQVDNPMAILNQDTSRNFLHSKSPTDKYRVGGLQYGVGGLQYRVGGLQYRVGGYSIG